MNADNGHEFFAVGSAIAFLLRQWFLIGLVALLTLGIALPEAMSIVTTRLSSSLVIATVLFLTTVPMDLLKSLAAPGVGAAVLLATAINMGLAPPVGWVASWGVSPDLAIGVVLATLAPCTVASAVVWTRRGGGNDAVAIAVTAITHLACFVSIPFWVLLLISNSEVVPGDAPMVDAWALLTKLFFIVFLPVFGAQLLRLVRPFARWADERKKKFSIAAQLGLLLVAFIGAVEAGRMLAAQESLPAIDILRLILMVGLAHTVLLVGSRWVARLFRLPEAEGLAVAIAGSQKTLAVGLGIALEFGGLAILPMVAYHIFQLLIDTVYVDVWGVSERGDVEQGY